MAMQFNERYAPLFRTSTRYTIVTGGRGSGKSYALAAAILADAYKCDGYNILYSRYTLTSAEISIIPEFTAKIGEMQLSPWFRIRRQDIECVTNRGRSTIWFRGLLGSSGNQVARLKSLNNLKTWVLDEAQELCSEDMFDTVDQSIRERDVANRVILVLNPADISHWIYRRFFKEAGIAYDYNGIKGNVTYIHTSYRDNIANLSPSFVQIAQDCRERDKERYEHLYLGKWLVRSEGLIYPRWGEVALADIPLGLSWWYANDWGYGGDQNALVRMAFDALTRTLYVVEVMYALRQLPRDVAAAIRQDCEGIGLSADDVVVYCDPARPDSIAELRGQYGVNAIPGINRDKAGRIGYLQGFSVRYVGTHIREEVTTYSWRPAKYDEGHYTDVPQDGGDHLMDAISYGTTHLRRMGISNDVGDLPK